MVHITHLSFPKDLLLMLLVMYLSPSLYRWRRWWPSCFVNMTLYNIVYVHPLTQTMVLLYYSCFSVRFESVPRTLVMYFYYSYVVNDGLVGACEVCGRCFTRDLGSVPCGPDYLARGCSGRKLLLVRGYFCAWIFICDPEESSVLLATHTREHVKFVGDMFYTWPCCMLVLCCLYTAPVRVHRCNHRQHSTVYGANGRGLHFSAFSFLWNWKPHTCSSHTIICKCGNYNAWSECKAHST